MKRKMKRGVALALILAAGCAGGPTAEELERNRIDRQLNELYRPLLSLVEESRKAIETFMETKLHREYIFPTDRSLEGEELKLWLQQAEGDTMPRNERMCALIRAKRDLVDGPDLPPSFKALLEHQDAWRAVHAKWKQDRVPTPTGNPRPRSPKACRASSRIASRSWSSGAPRLRSRPRPRGAGSPCPPG
jgi:hypothetical protein